MRMPGLTNPAVLLQCTSTAPVAMILYSLTFSCMQAAAQAALARALLRGAQRQVTAISTFSAMLLPRQEEGAPDRVGAGARPRAGLTQCQGGCHGRRQGTGLLVVVIGLLALLAAAGPGPRNCTPGAAVAGGPQAAGGRPYTTHACSTAPRSPHAWGACSAGQPPNAAAQPIGSVAQLAATCCITGSRRVASSCRQPGRRSPIG